MNKAQSQYISWILIFAMVVALSFILYKWSIERARSTAEKLESTADPMVCSQIGVSVDGICQTFRSLDMNITNINSMDIKGFLIRTVGLYPDDVNYLGSTIVFTNLPAGDSEKISILKKVTLSQAVIIPIVDKDNKNVYCEDKAATKEKGNLKQC